MAKWKGRGPMSGPTEVAENGFNACQPLAAELVEVAGSREGRGGREDGEGPVITVASVQDED